MTLLLVFLFLSIFFSFLCSVLEAVLLSVTPAYIRKEAHEGSKTGRLLEEYKEDIDRPLSAILTLNTIAHTVGAIGVGAQSGKIYGSQFIQIGAIEISYESIVACLMTLAILILSEIIPKTLGANNWEKLAPFTVQMLRVLLTVLAPFIWFSQMVTKKLKKEKDKPVLSRSELTMMADLGEESGTLQKQESQIIRNLVGLEQLTVRDIMTPKTVTLMANAESSLQDFYHQENPIPYSRIPVFETNNDNIIGILLKDDLLQEMVKGNNARTTKDICRDVRFVADTMELGQFFRQLSSERTHLSVVEDSYGSIVGIVSLEDLFETLLGEEILDESDAVADLQTLAKQKWEERRKRQEQEHAARHPKA